MLRAEREDVATPMRRQRGTTTRGICSALFAGHAKALDAIRAVIRSLIAPSLPIVRSHAVMLAASSGLRLNAFSGFGVGDAAVGQSNGIANGFDLLSAITFTHVFQLNCWPHRY